MQTLLMTGTAPLSNDIELMEQVKKHTDEEELGGPVRAIAILNSAGDLYRVLAATSPMDASRAVDALRDLGMIDRIGFDTKKLIEVDSLTGQALRTNWAAVLQFGNEPWPLPVLPRLAGLEPL